MSEFFQRKSTRSSYYWKLRSIVTILFNPELLRFYSIYWLLMQILIETLIMLPLSVTVLFKKLLTFLVKAFEAGSGSLRIIHIASRQI